MRYLMDTNVLVRSTETGHAQHRTTIDAIESLRTNGHELAIVPQVVYEFWFVATRPVRDNGLGMNVVDAQAAISAFTRFYRFQRDERAVYSEWEQIVTQFEVKGKKAHDARLVAVIEVDPILWTTKGVQ